ncbi:hypothetical protein [Roseobacter ponti]|uniref:Uncharacterized protein n=1 Tax=Roseobacter ponti TaxID=1891787 RepID=A0A858SWS2_9RHOB|nr:hypothetical protein [Roseobacter ponti]QJF52458.1 hypothetical protein G3256_15410 [Roseobacter ponti]
MRRAFPLYAATVVLALAGPAAAQDQRTISAHNMQLAVEICLRNYRTETALPQAFGAAGFSVSPGPDAGYASFAADGVTGAFSTSQAQGFCSVQSTLVDLATAGDLGSRMAQSLFPGQVHAGGPEHPVGAPLPPCAGLSVFAPQQLITITYAAAGNSGECITDGTSAVVINM